MDIADNIGLCILVHHDGTSYMLTFLDESARENSNLAIRRGPWQIANSLK